MRPRLIMLVFFGIAATAQGQNIYKCTDASGTVVFSESPCASDAERVYIDDSQSGISDFRAGEPMSIYPAQRTYSKPRTNNGVSAARAARNAEIAARKEAQRIEKIYDEAQREYDKVLRRGWNSKAAQRAANVALSKIDNPRGEQAQREYERMIRKGYNSKAAERSANVILGISSPVDDSPVPSSSWESSGSQTSRARNPPAHPIPSTSGGVYIPMSPEGEQYIAPHGGICQRLGPNLMCPDGFKPANGVVVEPPNQ